MSLITDVLIIRGANERQIASCIWIQSGPPFYNFYFTRIFWGFLFHSVVTTISGDSKISIKTSTLWFDAMPGFRTSLFVGCFTWWRHQMEFFSALLAFCAGNSPVYGEFPAQRPVTRSFDIFYLRLNQQLSKQWKCRYLRRHRAHYHVIVMNCKLGGHFVDS